MNVIFVKQDDLESILTNDDSNYLDSFLNALNRGYSFSKPDYGYVLSIFL